MAPLDTRFPRPSATALGMSALGVLSVGLISTGLWYDSHRSAQAVERAREQVSSGQTSQIAPEPVALTTSETSVESTTPEPTETSTESSESSASTETAEATATSVASTVPTTQAATARTVAVPQQARAAAGQPPAAAQPPAGVEPSAAPAEGSPGQGSPGEPSGPEITQPVEPGGAPGGLFPGLADIILPFLPQPNPVPPVPAAENRTAADGGAEDGAGARTTRGGEAADDQG